MTVTLADPVLIAAAANHGANGERATWRVAWSSTLQDPTYRVYHEGRLLFRAPGIESLDLTSAHGRVPYVEVFDDDTDEDEPADQEELAGRYIFQWYGVSGASAYRIERQDPDTGAWSAVDTLRDPAATLLTWTTPFLADGSTPAYRVVALDAAGDEAAALEMASAVVVRRPDTPRVAGAYDAAGGNLLLGHAPVSIGGAE